jgi:hypothetical protein
MITEAAAERVAPQIRHSFAAQELSNVQAGHATNPSVDAIVPPHISQSIDPDVLLKVQDGQVTAAATERLEGETSVFTIGRR